MISTALARYQPRLSFSDDGRHEAGVAIDSSLTSDKFSTEKASP